MSYTSLTVFEVFVRMDLPSKLHAQNDTPVICLLQNTLQVKARFLQKAIYSETDSFEKCITVDKCDWPSAKMWIIPDQ